MNTDASISDATVSKHGASKETIGHEEKIEMLEQENERLTQEVIEMEEKLAKEKQDSQDIINLLTKEIEKLTEKAENAQVELERKNRKYDEQEENYRHKMEQKRGEYIAEKNELLERIKQLENRVKEHEMGGFDTKGHGKRKMNMTGSHYTDANNVKQQSEKANLLFGENLPRKLFPQDRLLKAAAEQLDQTKSNLEKIKKEQKETSMKLTLLQNHQLVSELEYQSVQTEKLIEKTQKLEHQIAVLKRDNQIHIEIETELSKKSHHATALAKRFHERCKELEDDLSKIKNNNMDLSRNQNLSALESSQINADKKQRDDLISFLEKNLENAERKIGQLQEELNVLRNENEFLESKIDFAVEKFANAATLVKDNLDMILDGSFQGNQFAELPQNIALELNEIKSHPYEELDRSQKQVLLMIILEQMKPYLNLKLLQNPNFHVNYDEHVNILPQGNNYTEDLNNSYLPEINNNKDIDSPKPPEPRKFNDVPLEISTRILRGNVREWGGENGIGSAGKRKFKKKI